MNKAENSFAYYVIITFCIGFMNKGSWGWWGGTGRLRQVTERAQTPQLAKTATNNNSGLDPMNWQCKEFAVADLLHLFLPHVLLHQRKD